MKNLTVGILAHVDAGKTTLSEALLYLSGAIRSPGRVDNGNTFLDTDAEERKRGITIYSKTARFTYGDTAITLLDTPGHVDFSGETERVLAVLDAAILVVSGTSGVQSHTETLFRLLARHRTPVFVNKTDMPWLGKDKLLKSMREKLSPAIVDGENLAESEDAATCSHALMEEYLANGTLSETSVRSAVAAREIMPCFFGSALKNTGVKEFLDAFTALSDEPPRGKTTGGRVFKITHDEHGARLCHLKLTGGSLAVRDKIGIGETSEKVNEIRLYSGTKYETAQSVSAGMIAAVTGLDSLNAGDAFGDECRSTPPVLEPVLSYRLIFDPSLSPHTVMAKLRVLEEEDPLLRLSFNEQTSEIHVLLMGEVQKEVLAKLIKDRFGYDFDFGAGRILYRETIADTVEGVGHYEPLRHYAEVHLLLEPMPAGSGLSFATDCSTDDLSRSFQRLILTHLEEKEHKGVLTGSPVTDMRITLVSGRAHKKHTEGGDFRQATYRAVRQGLRSASSILLEPWYRFTLSVPTEAVGRAMNDVQNMGGRFSPPDNDGETATLSGEAPVSEMIRYPLILASYTHGKGRLSTLFSGYAPCHNAEEVIAEIGYDPDADITNSADSVFCSGGAGVFVPWDEVPHHMHLPSVLDYNAEEEEAKELRRVKAQAYAKSVATDKELLAIFERTYGKIKPRETGTAPHYNPSAAKERPLKTVKKPPVTDTGDAYYLIDGYNILYAVDDFRRDMEKGLDFARNRLIERLCNFQGYDGSKIILVFDAYRVKKNPGTVEKFRNIHVVYTKEAETADTYIERVSKELVKEHHRVRVATSDGPEQMIILGNGALRIPAAAFYKELTDAEKAIGDLLAAMTIR